ncbi:DUF3231 family protein [Cytobacillus suaedae]|nr:DUF3231 family protein [Cytobacillus suaedae]
MPNPFESFWNTLKLSIDNVNESKHPLHTGEVTICWTYYTALKEFIRYEEIGLNTTDDDEVKEMLKDAKKLCESQTKRLEEFMLMEGIPLPELPSKKPKSDLNEVPLGVKFTDDELTNGVSIKVATAIIECATGQAQAIRTDLGLMWVEFHTELLTFGTTLKSLMRKRGWIRVPPYYYPPGMPKK